MIVLVQRGSKKRWRREEKESERGGGGGEEEQGGGSVILNVSFEGIVIRRCFNLFLEFCFSSR